MKEKIDSKLALLDDLFNMELLTAELINDKSCRLGCDGCDGGCRGGGFFD